MLANIYLGRTIYRKGPKRTEKDQKGPKRTEKDRKGAKKLAEKLSKADTKSSMGHPRTGRSKHR